MQLLAFRLPDPYNDRFCIVFPEIKSPDAPAKCPSGRLRAVHSYSGTIRVQECKGLGPGRR